MVTRREQEQERQQQEQERKATPSREVREEAGVHKGREGTTEEEVRQGESQESRAEVDRTGERPER